MEEVRLQKRYDKLGFKPQKEIVYNKLLPYSDKLDDDSVNMLKDVKGNLGRLIILREQRPGCISWVVKLQRYIRLYGIKFSKEDHLIFIKLAFEGITIPNLEPFLVTKFANLLILLLKKKELITQNDLVLPWRPLYELYKKMTNYNLQTLGIYKFMTTLETTVERLIHEARHYFSPEMTQEVLDEFRPMLCPFDVNMMYNGISCLENFMPLCVPPEKSHLGYKLWFDEMMNLWNTLNNSPNWEKEMMWLMARLAHCNIGYIDWEEHMPLMFTRFLRSMSLPVVYKNSNMLKSPKIEAMSIGIWIVSTLGGGSSCQDYLDKFMKSVESYFYPANYGRWFIRLKELLQKLPHYFINRLHRERYQEITWLNPIPEEKKLTEEDITRFVQCLKPAVMSAVFSKLGGPDIAQSINQLAGLRPKLIIPDMIDLMYTALDTLTEPHRYTAAMHCVAAVSRPMVEGIDYPEGPTHIVPLLFATLPGIDPNDFRKCFITFQFITSFAVMISFVDCSTASEYWTDLTPEEEVTCSSTAQLEDFVLQFLDRCFLLIENSSFENIRLEEDVNKPSRLEYIAESAIASSCFSILNQTSLPIFNNALQKLYSFVTSRILETKVSGRYIATMCGAFARVRPDVTLKLLLPRLCENVMSLIENVNLQTEELLDNELLYNMLILSEIVNCQDGHLSSNNVYLPMLQKIMDETLHAKCRECNVSASNILGGIFTSLCSVSPSEYSISNAGVDCPISERLPIRDWAKPGDIHNLNMSWSYPKEEQFEAVQQLISKYLPKELDILDKYVKNELTLSREELYCSLRIIISCLTCSNILPDWDEPPLHLVDGYTHLKFAPTLHCVYRQLTMPDGSNIKRTVVNAVSQLQKKLLETAEDDTKSFFSIITIWELTLLHTCKVKDEYDTYWKNFLMTKKILENRLRRGKRHLRPLLIERTKLQHLKRKAYFSTAVTETHKLIFHNLFTLATSYYSEVRVRAQLKLFTAVDHYTYSYKLLIPKIVENLRKDPNEFHELFKGSLYTLVGPKNNPICSRYDWKMLNTLWPVIITSKPSEKLSISKLLVAVTETFHKHFPTITISATVPQSFINVAKELWTTAPEPDSNMPTVSEEENGLALLNKRNKENLSCYLELLGNIHSAIVENNLHWRHHFVAFSFLRDLVHPDVPYPKDIVNIIFQTLIHDSLDLRKLALRCSVYALKQHKRQHIKYEVTVEEMVALKKKDVSVVESVKDCKISDTEENCHFGDRQDNKWLHYSNVNKPTTKELWEKPYYQHSRYIGYYTWPKVLHVYAPPSEQPALDRNKADMTPEELQVYEFFSQKSNVDKLITHYSMEEKKGKDKFNGFRFILFKSLFRNYGDLFLDVFKPHIVRLVEDRQESSQRCAAELVAGLIRGSKHWTFEKVESLWEFLTPLVRKALNNMTEETVTDWGICFATSAENRDPNRHHWMLEVLMEDPLRSEASYLNCGRLYALQGVLNQQEWRISELFHRLLDYFMQYHLTHPFQNVRERVGSILTNMFEMDLQDISNVGGVSSGPKVKDFVKAVLPRVESLHTVAFDPGCKLKTSQSSLQNGIVEDAEKEAATIRLFKTVIKWIVSSCCRAQYSSLPEFFLFLPLACVMESYEKDAEIASICCLFLSSLAQSLTLYCNVPIALDAIFKVGELKSWWARESCLRFLSVYVFHNMGTVVSNPEWVSKIIDFVLRLMVDENPEVRDRASVVLSGLIHCEIISPEKQEEILKKCRLQCRTTLKQKQVNDLATRHAGVLGLCAFICASPYDVPDNVPQIFEELGAHLNDPQPIPSTIRKTLGEFKRTHQDNWIHHKNKFTEEQLIVLSDLIVPPSYYA